MTFWLGLVHYASLMANESIAVNWGTRDWVKYACLQPVEQPVWSEFQKNPVWIRMIGLKVCKQC
jgi:hypothetical protein